MRNPVDLGAQVLATLPQVWPPQPPVPLDLPRDSAEERLPCARPCLGPAQGPLSECSCRAQWPGSPWVLRLGAPWSLTSNPRWHISDSLSHHPTDSTN